MYLKERKRERERDERIVMMKEVRGDERSKKDTW